MTRFGNAFPQRLDDIATLRRCNRAFDEICRDYEVLLDLLPRNALDPVYPDIRDSLSGLEAEIRAHLDAGAGVAAGIGAMTGKGESNAG